MCRSPSARRFRARRRRSSRTRSPIHLPRPCFRCRAPNRARIFVVRRLVCLRAVRRRHRSVLGALARARVPNQAQARLPAQAKASLGPDATGVGWIYEYALVDRSGSAWISRSLRALQDWFLKYELKSVPMSRRSPRVGGMVRQYQVVLDPDRLRAYNIPHGKVIDAMQRRQPGNGRFRHRARRSGIHGPRLRLSAVARGLPPHSARRQRRRRAVC